MTDIHELIGELNNILDETKRFHEDGKRNAYHTKEGMRVMLAAVEELVDKEVKSQIDCVKKAREAKDRMWLNQSEYARDLMKDFKEELQKLKEALQ